MGFGGFSRCLERFRIRDIDHEHRLRDREQRQDRGVPKDTETAGCRARVPAQR